MKRPPVCGILLCGGILGGVSGMATYYAMACELWPFAALLGAATAAIAWETWVEIREARRGR